MGISKDLTIDEKKGAGMWGHEPLSLMVQAQPCQGMGSEQKG